MVQSLLKLTLVGLLVAICGAQSYDFFEDLHARYAAAESINKFSFEFLEEVFKGYNENAAVSTFDPYVLLSIIANGVKGPAKKQLESRLYLNKTAFEKAGIKSLIEKYQAFKKYEFKAAGKIFHSNSFNLKSSFVDETQNIYKSSPASVDFSKTDEAAKAINEWASQSVDSQFQNFISSDKFDQSTQSVLVNALYFKGKFSKKFESFSLTSKPFYFADGSSRDIPTLKTYGSFGAGYLFPGQFAKFIRLPFEYQTGNEALYAYIVVPNNSSNFHYVEKNLHKIDFSAFNAKDEAQFNCYIPKFKYQSTYDLEYVFRYFGIDNIFSYAADFSGMTDNKNKINRFYQKTIVEFDEFHGETANAAVVQDGQNKANDFYVDQPFFVFVVSNDVVVAASRIYDPTKAY